MTSIRLSNDIDAKLNKLASVTKRSKSFFIKEAIEKYLEEMEDTYVALERIANPTSQYVSTKDLRNKLNNHTNDL